MKSLRQLTFELTGVRLNATNVSLWQTAATLTESARTAINDAIGLFPTRVQEVAADNTVHAGGIVIVPRGVEEVVRVEACGGTTASRYPLKHWDFYPTSQTTYLRVFDVTSSSKVDVTYLHTQGELPIGLYVASDMGVTGILTTPSFAPASQWPAGAGYLELSDGSTGVQDLREVVHYNSINSSGFWGITRQVEGSTAIWPAGVTRVSAVWVAPADAMRPMMLQAQASMYEFWITHRMQYEQYTAIASMQALNVEDLQLLIRDFEARAAVARRRNRRLPPPSAGKRRRAIPR